MSDEEYPTKKQLHEMMNKADKDFNRLVDAVNVLLSHCSNLDLDAMGKWLDEYSLGPEGYGAETKPCKINWRKIIDESA